MRAVVLAASWTLPPGSSTWHNIHKVNHIVVNCDDCHKASLQMILQVKKARREPNDVYAEYPDGLRWRSG